MKKVIWLNHWFSTAYNIVSMLKESGEFWVIGSNEQEFSVLKEICDEWYSEPDKCSDEEYIDFCLKFCDEHNVNVFMPHRHLTLISRFKDKFEEINVKVMVDDYTIISILNDKKASYDYFKNVEGIHVPDYYVVDKLEDFLEAYKNLSDKYRNVCFKFVKDEGGKSYRLIDNHRKGYAALFKKQNTRMTLDSVIEALSEKEVFSPIMVMPFLEGDEISIDCLKTDSGNIMVPRVKSTARFERISYDKDILRLCTLVLDNVNLECPCNVQFKYMGDVPYFLEINTRMSGGVHMTCKAADVNIPYVAVKKLMGQPVNWLINEREVVISQVEVPLFFE
ncbi:ATP-grasp domain-containing protein [Butyrivibrio sp. AC2005]|uniref:ATP-grasp domain-containing protein n=1 Tax=Butyrivibrio sp. AC2005 TaxID=1280672 RepID=UPI000403E616|nr:ATP-grasp domain-containing protein [Butyrivibrio sp. AC2005]